MFIWIISLLWPRFSFVVDSYNKGQFEGPHTMSENYLHSHSFSFDNCNEFSSCSDNVLLYSCNVSRFDSKCYIIFKYIRPLEDQRHCQTEV